MRHLTGLIFILGVCSAGPLQATELAAHRAHYDLTLERGRGDVIAASGSMDYDVADACDAWAVRQRLHMVLTGRDGTETEILSDYTTIETKDGSSLRFRLRQSNASEPPTEIAGKATVGKDGGEAVYTAPESTTKQLPAGTLLPMAHTEALIAAAKSGKKFIALPVFDGTGVDGAQDSAVAIINWESPRQGPWPALANLSSGRMRIAFFDRQSTGQQAEYEVSMRYYENGIADDMSMDFGEFVMAAKLKNLVVPKPGC
jgi:hypothetical protein